jgi:hypothetical protein
VVLSVSIDDGATQRSPWPRHCTKLRPRANVRYPYEADADHMGEHRLEPAANGPVSGDALCPSEALGG